MVSKDTKIYLLLLELQKKLNSCRRESHVINVDNGFCNCLKTLEASPQFIDNFIRMDKESQFCFCANLEDVKQSLNESHQLVEKTMNELIMQNEVRRKVMMANTSKQSYFCAQTKCDA